MYPDELLLTGLRAQPLSRRSVNKRATTLQEGATVNAIMPSGEVSSEEDYISASYLIRCSGRPPCWTRTLRSCGANGEQHAPPSRTRRHRRRSDRGHQGSDTSQPADYAVLSRTVGGVCGAVRPLTGAHLRPGPPSKPARRFAKRISCASWRAY